MTIRTPLRPFACMFVATMLSGVSAETAAVELRAGPMAGASYMRGVKLWVQADGPAKAVIEYWDAKIPTKIMRTPPISLRETEDYVAHFAIGQLEPGHTYGYQVRLDGKRQKVAQALLFKTQHLWQWRADAPDWKLAFGSCAYTNEIAYDRPGKPYGGPPEALQIYDNIAQQKPDMMLWGGDNLYHREVDQDSEAGLRYRWKRDRGLPQMQNLLRTSHHFAIWDDHDYGANDSNSSNVLKGESLKLFKRYFANPSYGLPETPGIFGNFIFNDAEFFLTDNRYHRDSDELIADDKTMLGAAQLRWLKNALLASVSPVKIIVVASQVTNAANRWEGWDKFPAERADILKFLVEQKINGVMIFSGDRHFTELLKTERAGSYPLYELTCSPLTSGVPSRLEAEQSNPQIVADTFVAERNFCTLDFSGSKKERTITMRSFSSQGRELWRQDIPLSSLQSPR